MAQRRSLKVLTLNAWGGRAIDALIPFLDEKGRDIDVFCFQEVFDARQDLLEETHPGEGLRGDLFRVMRFLLPDHDGHFARFEDRPHRMSLAMFLRRDLDVRAYDDFTVHEPERPKEHGSVVLSPRRLQHATVRLNGRDVLVVNYHGLWVNGPKTDTPERIEQSRRVKAFLEAHAVEPKVFCGDLNLLPDTESLAIIADGMYDLVSADGVASTRTPLYRHYENPDEPNFADYILTKGVRILRFEVLPDHVSDHAPLLVEIA